MHSLLIVDDEAQLVRNIANYFESFQNKYRIFTAYSGEEALDLLRREPVDLVLTDFRLPGIDGIEVLRQATDVRPGIRVIVMTAFSSPELRRLSTQAGAVKFLPKPIDLSELRKMVQAVLEESAGWSGHMDGLDIFDLANLLIFSGKSKHVSVSLGSEKGELVFKNGQLIYANTDDLAGDEAFFRMTLWRGGKFNELPPQSEEDYPTNIFMSTTHLLMEAARRRDELNRDQAEEPVLRPQDEELDLAPPTEKIKVDSIVESYPERSEAMAGLKSMLEEMITIEGIRTAVLVGRDGFVIEGVSRDGRLNTEDVGAVISTGIGSSEVIGKELLVGVLNQGMFEYTGGVIVMVLVGPDAVLSIVADASCNLGNIRYQLKKRVPQLEAAI